VRNIFFVLLLVNLAFLAWSAWVDVPVPAAAAASAGSLQRLRLVGEDTAQATSPGTGEGGSAAQCVSVGPFDDLASATRGVDVLKKKGFDARQRQATGPNSDGYWVYVAELKTDSVANLALRNLTGSGIREATALQASEDEWRIFVGLFTEREMANRRVDDVRRLGLRAEVAERKLPTTLFWVDVAVHPEDGTLPAHDLYRGPSAHIGARPCPAGSPLPSSGDPARPGRRPMGQRAQGAAVASIPKPL